MRSQVCDKCFIRSFGLELFASMHLTVYMLHVQLRCGLLLHVHVYVVIWTVAILITYPIHFPLQVYAFYSFIGTHFLKLSWYSHLLMNNDDCPFVITQATLTQPAGYTHNAYTQCVHTTNDAYTQCVHTMRTHNAYTASYSFNRLPGLPNVPHINTLSGKSYLLHLCYCHTNGVYD